MNLVCILWDEVIEAPNSVMSDKGYKIIYKDEHEIDIELQSGEVFVIPLVEEERNLVENLLVQFGFGI